jgi:hypothetical protein
MSRGAAPATMKMPQAATYGISDLRAFTRGTHLCFPSTTDQSKFPSRAASSVDCGDILGHPRAPAVSRLPWWGSHCKIISPDPSAAPIRVAG